MKEIKPERLHIVSVTCSFTPSVIAKEAMVNSSRKNKLSDIDCLPGHQLGRNESLNQTSISERKKLFSSKHNSSRGISHEGHEKPTP